VQDGKGPAANIKEAAAATAETARAAMGNAQVVADAVGGVQENLAHMAKVGSGRWCRVRGFGCRGVVKR
jgi:hypothetical protein